MDLSLELLDLSEKIEGEIKTDNITRIIYSTDASAYKEMPDAVIFPKNKNDIKEIILFANKFKIPIIPRTAGTSLAGQVVGKGIIVDVSKHLTKIIEIDGQNRTVTVQPGVIRDELNLILAKHKLFFAPETSTSNRAMIGGMVGNNSCGAHSLIHGSTRDHLISVKGFLADGSEVEFGALSNEDFKKKTVGVRLENKIYKQINKILSDKFFLAEIEKEYPYKEIKRRNTGYALDVLAESSAFSNNNTEFNFSKLIAGSEGTLFFITEIKLNLTTKLPLEKALVCVHLNSVAEAAKANLIALKHKPDAIELMDKDIMDLSKENITQKNNRFFINGDPGAIIIVEFLRTSKENILEEAKAMELEMRENNLGFDFPIIWGNDINKVWDVRKAGLGLLANIPGDLKTVPVIEDTAVRPADLPNYLVDFQNILDKHNLKCVYYAHIDTGELHFRPLINLKTIEGQEVFRDVAEDVAKLVKKYKGSLSGEHGDGRLRGEFIPLMYGEKIYNTFREIKKLWDTNNIYNPGKIIDTPPMDSFLRYNAEKEIPQIDTIFDFSATQGILRAAEKCNGSADCRKTHLSQGTMCPSYQASKNESQTTRARANILREFLTNSKQKNKFNHKEIYDVMDLCLSCKACKSECPSNVDVAKLKAEFLQHYYDENGAPLRSKLIANISKINKIVIKFNPVTNLFFKCKITSYLINSLLGFSVKRQIPLLHKTTLNNYISKIKQESGKNGKVYLFVDEFTNFNDVDLGIIAIRLLNKLGYEVVVEKNVESGRTYLSKGFLRKAKELANENVKLLSNKITNETPLIGIEPSAILTFRDEYPELVDKELVEKSKELAKNALMIDEFLASEFEKGKFSTELFTKEKQHIKLHGHCQQKAIASTKPTIKLLSIPENYTCEEIPSGCCGMAGSFGYEKEHYDLSMKIGELVLFPNIRKTEESIIIAATGTSCRHQIKDGTNRKALHPIEILYNAIIPKAFLTLSEVQ